MGLLKYYLMRLGICFGSLLEFTLNAVKPKRGRVEEGETAGLPVLCTGTVVVAQQGGSWPVQQPDSALLGRTVPYFKRKK